MPPRQRRSSLPTVMPSVVDFFAEAAPPEDARLSEREERALMQLARGAVAPQGGSFRFLSAADVPVTPRLTRLLSRGLETAPIQRPSSSCSRSRMTFLLVSCSSPASTNSSRMR